MQDEQELPIDIHTNKLLDWLTSRRHCKQQWQNDVQVIRKKISVAIQDMPAVDEIVQLLSGLYINYFHCVQIVELLKETESASKNIFGSYSSKRMKDWQEIVKLYEKDNVYLAEVAQMLIRNVNYEVPSLKRQIVKCQQIQEECDKKEVECVKRANDLREKYRQECKQLGIEGAKIKTELVARLTELPKVYGEIAGDLTGLKEAIEFYSAFKVFILEREVEDNLPLLNYLITHGNTTTYEWIKGVKPVEIREPPLKIFLADEEDQQNNEIDFGDDSGAVIDFGDQADGIDFGEQTDAIDFGDDSNTNEISWDVTPDTNSDVKSDTDGLAEGDNALSVLDNLKTRNQVLDELGQLEAFLDQRIIEVQSDDGTLSLNPFENAPSNLLLTKEVLITMMGSVKEIINRLTDVKVLKLQLIRNSPQYVDRIANTLKQSLVAAEKINRIKDAVIRKREKTIEELKAVQPQLTLIISRTTELQAQIQADISKRYKNRHVNLMGGVKTLGVN